MNGRDLSRIRDARATVAAARRAVAYAMRRPTTYPAFLREMLWTGVNLAFYPAGLVSDALDLEDEVRFPDAFRPGMPLRYLEPEAAATPIVLLHGYFHNRSAFMVMRRHLRRHGFRTVDTMNYNVIGNDVPELADRLAVHVAQVLERTGGTKVHLVGHSLGGLVARYYVQRLGGDETVHTCITLGTPHEGTYAAWAGRGRALRQLRPGSRLLSELRDSARATPVRFVSFYSNVDAAVLPPASAKLTHPALRATNILVKDHGHMSLLISRPLIRSIVHILASLDADARDEPQQQIIEPTA